jgi:hypothetical protein
MNLLCFALFADFFVLFAVQRFFAGTQERLCATPLRTPESNTHFKCENPEAAWTSINWQSLSA